MRFGGELQGLAGIVRDILPWQHQSGIGRETGLRMLGDTDGEVHTKI